jgi:3-phenylpropionate/cinnamic acid dioxygenase small subunit
LLDTSVIVHVNQLLNHYGHIVDAKDWDRFDELFLADATLDYTAVGAARVFEGVAEIQNYFRRANHPSAHHVVNIYVYERDHEIRAQSKFFVPFTRASHVPVRWYGGDYDDIVVDTPDGWRFQHRKCTPRWQLTSVEGDVPAGRHTW